MDNRRVEYENQRRIHHAGAGGGDPPGSRGQTALQFNGMITLNPVSAQIWRSLEQGAPYEEILRGILDQFDVAEDTARQDLDRFLEEMRGRDLLEE